MGVQYAVGLDIDPFGRCRHQEERHAFVRPGAYDERIGKMSVNNDGFPAVDPVSGAIPGGFGTVDSRCVLSRLITSKGQQMLSGSDRWKYGFTLILRTRFDDCSGTDQGCTQKWAGR